MKINNPELAEKLEDLVAYIGEYESDTFSASSRNLTKLQATELVELLLIDAVARIDSNLDGITLSEKYNSLG